MPYFDSNATAPLHPVARAAWLEAVDHGWHNPSSLFAAGTAARERLDDARERLGDLLGCTPDRIVFTAGATSANNMLARHLGRRRSRVLISPLEHPALAESCHAELPGGVAELPIDSTGRVTAAGVAMACAAGPFDLVSVMAASNESGVLQPWDDLAATCRRLGIRFHTDAAQWLGRLPAHGLGDCDYVTGTGHKFGGPKGVGFLVVPSGDQDFRGDRGGPQESGRHAGTENLPGIAALVATLEVRDAEATAEAQTGIRQAARDAAERRIVERLPDARVVSGGAPRLWNTLAVVIPDADGRRLVARLAAAGIDASTGAACSAGAAAAARIVAAIGPAGLDIPADRPFGMVRFSATHETTAADWLAAADALVAAVSDPRPLPHVRTPPP